MHFTSEGEKFRIQLNTQGCELSANEIAEMEEDLHSLRNAVESFPVSRLQITVVHHAKSDDYHVKTSLMLSGKTLFTGERDVLVHPAYERCVRKLVRKVEAFKQNMHGDAELAKQAKATHATVEPTGTVDTERLKAAVEADDYPAFRQAADVFDNSLTERVGRWLQRYPEIELGLGESVTISEIVEDVFLNAYEQFPSRPDEVPPGDWLEGLIDPTVQALMLSPDEEYARISYAKTAVRPR